MYARSALDGSRAHLQRVEHIAMRLRERVRIDRDRERDERLVLRATTETQQLGFGEIAIGDVDARAERGGDADVARHVAQRAEDRESRVAERERVADLRVERDEKRRIDDGVRSVLERLPFVGRRRLDLSIVGRTGTHGAHLHEPRAVVEERHRREGRDARVAGPARTQRVEERERGRGERTPRADREIRAEQRAGLHVDRADDVGGVGIDGDERGDADRDRRHREHEAAARRAGVAPGEGSERAPAEAHVR